MENNPCHPAAFARMQSFLVLVLALWMSVTGAGFAAPATGAATGEGAGASTVSSTYRLSPYDVIDVSVYNEEDLHTRARLGSDGSVLLPLIGNIHLGGMSVAEANEAIQKRYSSGFVKDPHIMVSVIEARRTTFSILGQVTRPGIYEIPEGSHMTIVDAVLLAGGFTRLAAQNNVKVKRIIKGHAKVFSVHAGDMADDEKVAPFEIEPGDVIKVNESWF